MRILFVYDSLSPIGGGSQIAVLNWLKNFERKNIEFRLLTSSYSASFLKKANLIRSAKIIAIPAINLSFLLPQFYVSPLVNDSVKKEINNFYPDIIQLNEASLLDFQLLSFAQKNGIKIGGFFHSFYEKFFGPGPIVAFYRSQVYKKTDFILVPSQHVLEKVKTLYKNKSIYRVFYPINKTFFLNKSPKSINTRQKTLVFIGRLSPEKRVAFILDILKLLPKNFNLKIIGDGIEKNKLIKKSIKDNTSDRATFLGHLSQPEIAKCLKTAFLVIHPCIAETFGIVYLESLAANIPLIVADYRVSREVIPNGCCQFLPGHNPQDWANKILTIERSPQFYSRLKKNIINNDKYLFRHHENISTQNLLEIYQKIIYH